MGAAEKVKPISADLAATYAAKIMAEANNEITPEGARNIFLACTALTQFARDAEHAAFLMMSEIMGNGNVASANDFEKFMRDHLGKVKTQLVFIGGVINGKVEG